MAACSALAAVAAGPAAAAPVINYPNFSSVSGLRLNGTAVQNGSNLELAAATGNQDGSAYSTTEISPNASFSTSFEISETNGSSPLPADGITFVLQSDGPTAVGNSELGGYLGYEGISPSVAVEFAIYNGNSGQPNNGGGALAPPDGEFIGINENGNADSDYLACATHESPPLSPCTKTFSNDLYNAPIYGWVDYNAITHVFSVYESGSPSQPAQPLLSTTIDLGSVLGSNTFAGFTAGTGLFDAEMQVQNWELSSAVAGTNGSGTSVICNLDVATNVDTCTATVGSAGAPGTPTGKVNFTSESGGDFILGNSCQLSPTPLSIGVASCSVQWAPPNSNFPDIIATYQGDTKFGQSSGSTTFLFPSDVTGLENDDGPTTTCGCCPSSGDATTANAGDTVVSKLCSLVATGAIGYGTYVACAAAAAAPETVVAPVACVALLAAAGISISYLKDPPDPNVLSLALPKAITFAGRRKIHCRKLSKRKCTQLQKAETGYLHALEGLDTAGMALGTTGDRLTTARADHDAEAILFQIAARKVYLGQVGDAMATANLRATKLARLLVRDHLNSSVKLPSPKALIAKLQRTHPAAFNRAVKASGNTRSYFKKQLLKALRAVRERRRVKVASIIGRPLPSKQMSEDYETISLVNIRALVFGLGNDGAISPTVAGALLDELQCTSGKTKPNITGFNAIVAKGVPAPYASILTFAIAPLGSAPGCS